MADRAIINEELAHFGVQGMRWGVRKDRDSKEVSRSTVRMVDKDVKRYSDAKMFYGKEPEQEGNY